MNANSVEQAGQPSPAVASLVCGIAGLVTFLCFLGLPLAVAAVIVGLVARGQARSRGVGAGMANAGIALGLVTLVGAFIVALAK